MPRKAPHSSRPLRLGATLAAAALALACGQSGGGGGGGAGAEGSGGGGGAAPVEGCVDIRADERLLGDAEAWGSTADTARQPFWVDERGVHFVWTVREKATNRALLVVTSFDRETGALLENRLYEAFPPDVGAGMTGIDDAAGSPDGAFAAAISHADDSAPWGLREQVALGHLDQPAVTLWEASWSADQAGNFDVGWDGEAFAVHARSQTGPDVRLARVAPDGALLTADTSVGAIGNVFLEDSAFLTDADSGKSWMLNILSSTTWLSGHERDGTPFAGTEADGGVVLDFYAEGGLGLAAAGERALIGGTSSGATALQALLGTQLEGEPVLLFHDESFYATRMALAADGAGWWMGLLEVETGIHSYRLDAAGQVLSKSPLVTYTTCSASCGGPQNNVLNVYLLSTVRYQDELWLGFKDETDCWTGLTEHPVASCPFRILKVKDGCTYLTEFELNNPPE